MCGQTGTGGCVTHTADDAHAYPMVAVWNNVTGSLADGTATIGVTQLMSRLCVDCSACPCSQPVAVMGVLPDGKTLQLNTTFVMGTPKTLTYAFADYPLMTVFDAEFGRPAPPFNVTLR